MSHFDRFDRFDRFDSVFMIQQLLKFTTYEMYGVNKKFNELLSPYICFGYNCRCYKPHIFVNFAVTYKETPMIFYCKSTTPVYGNMLCDLVPENLYVCEARKAYKKIDEYKYIEEFINRINNIQVVDYMGGFKSGKHAICVGYNTQKGCVKKCSKVSYMYEITPTKVTGKVKNIYMARLSTVSAKINNKILSVLHIVGCSYKYFGSIVNLKELRIDNIYNCSHGDATLPKSLITFIVKHSDEITFIMDECNLQRIEKPLNVKISVVLY